MSAVRYRHLPLGGSLAADFTPRPDGTTLVLSTEPLRDYPARLTDRLIHWAATKPGHTLVAKRDDLPVYDRVFHEFFGESAPLPFEQPEPAVQVSSASAEEAEDEAEGEQELEPELLLASEIEILKDKSFARCSDEELDQLAHLMARVKLAVPLRRSRRRKRAKAGVPDLRQTIRRSFRTGGEPHERAYRERRRRRRRLVLFLDVSGSMASYSRALLVFAHAALRADH